MPEADDWLSSAEGEALARLRVSKRRREWRLGRWTAKRALVAAGAITPQALDSTALARVSIEASGAGVPLAWIDGRPAGWTISPSHAGDWGLGAVAAGRVVIGCDIETIDRRGAALVVDYFTAAERAQAGDSEGEERARRALLIWSAKESALKALGVGLRAGLRDVDVELQDDGPPDEWRPLAVRTRRLRFRGWWQAMEDRVMTVVADPAPAMPTRL